MNNPTEDDIRAVDDYLSQPHIQFGIYGRETGDSGTPHLQGFISTRSGVALATLRNRMSARAHFEHAKGTVAQNIVYCSKQGDVRQFGTPPAVRTLADYGAASELAIAGDLLAIQPELLVRYFSNLRGLMLHQSAAAAIANPPRDLPLDPSAYNLWLFGPPGGGKSFLASVLCTPDVYRKSLREIYWTDYRGQSHVLYDDFDRDSFGDLKIVADRYPFNAPRKHLPGTLIRPHAIVVTSNYLPSELYSDPVYASALSRRFTLCRVAGRQIERVFNFNNLGLAIFLTFF